MITTWLICPAGSAFTVRLTVVLLLDVPAIPVIVTVAVPVAAVAVAVKVSALEVDPGLGLKVAVTPLGKPEADSATLPEPLDGVTVMVLVPWPSCPTVTLLGEEESVKLKLLLDPELPQPVRVAAK